MTLTPLKTPVISLKGAKKTYRNFELGPIDLRVESGCIVAVVGRNGSGKSTLMGMLMNLIHPDKPGARAFSTPGRSERCAAGRWTRRGYRGRSTAPPWERSSTSSAHW